MTAVAPRRFDDPPPPSPFAAAGALIRAHWGLLLAFTVAATVAVAAAAAVLLTARIGSAALATAIAATPIGAVVATDTPISDVQAVGAAIRSLPGVGTATLRPKDDALRSLAANGLPSPDGRNPLPDVWVVSPDPAPVLRGERTLADTISTLQTAIGNVPKVESVRVDDRWVALLAAVITEWISGVRTGSAALLGIDALLVACVAFVAGRGLGGAGPQEGSTGSSRGWALALVALISTLLANSAGAALVYCSAACVPRLFGVDIGTAASRELGSFALVAIATLVIVGVGFVVGGAGHHSDR